MASAVPTQTSTTTEQSDAGKTVIDDIVVVKIAAAAAQEMRGIAGMGSSGVTGALGDAFSSVAQSVGGGSSNQPSTQGVTVQVGQKEAVINLNIVVEYGARIPQVVSGLRQNISDRVNTLTGLDVKAINVEVSDVHFPQQQQQQGEQPQ